MRRRKGLGADPEKVREFIQRGRGQLARKPMRRTKRPQRPEEGPLSPREWFDEVWELSKGLCTVTRTRVPRELRYTRHHPLPKRVLRDRGLHHLVWDPRNGVLVQPKVHRQHENGTKRIPYEALPQRCKDFAAELGPWAEDRLKQCHPPTGSSRERDDRGGQPW